MREALTIPVLLFAALPVAGAPELPASLPTSQALLWAALGILVSVVLPILRALIPKPPVSATPALPGTPSPNRFLLLAKPYAVVGAFSILTAILIVALAGDTLRTWNMAVLAGYAWDSTLQKLAKP
jgi:hypothetical protein